MNYPKAITSIHQIEITSRCNLACPYCVHPQMSRPKVDMDMETYLHALTWAKHFVDIGSQGELNLAGIGESTIHPQFLEYVRLARAIVGDGIKIVIASNGLAITEEMADILKIYNLRIYISLHRPEKAGRAIEILKKVGLIDGYSIDPALSAVDWAGQVDWFTSATMTPCSFLHNGKVMVMADGRVNTCCLDATGIGVIGHIRDDIDKMTVQPYKLCDQCIHVH